MRQWLQGVEREVKAVDEEQRNQLLWSEYGSLLHQYTRACGTGDWRGVKKILKV
jgi:hypothetical protein